MNPPCAAIGMLAEIEGIELGETVEAHARLPASTSHLERGGGACQAGAGAHYRAMFFSIMTWDRLLLFIAAELIFSLTPGPTVMMISAYGFRGGWRDAVAAICGTQTGNALWYGASVAGLGALVLAWPLAFTAIRLAGAAYLVWLGVSEIRASFRAADGAAPRLTRAPYMQALLTQLGNPKALLFFAALVPQFLDTGRSLAPQYVLMFVITFLGESAVLGCYGWLAAAGGRAAAGHAVWRERISGAVLIGLGLTFAVAHP
jgi:homoserine/homoserine lactone efflux protein